MVMERPTVITNDDGKYDNDEEKEEKKKLKLLR